MEMCDELWQMSLPVVDLLLPEYVADEDDAGDEIDEDGEEGERVAAGLSGRLLLNHGVGVVERQQEAREGDDSWRKTVKLLIYVYWQGLSSSYVLIDARDGALLEVRIILTTKLQRRSK